MCNIVAENEVRSVYKILIQVVTCIILILLFILPSINSSVLSNSTISAKTFFFAYILLILLFISSCCIFIKNRFSFKLSRIDIALMMLIGYFLVNRYYLQIKHSFSIRFIDLLGLCLLYLILRNLRTKNFLWFLIAIVVSGAVQSIYGVHQLLEFFPSNHSGFKMTGSYFNPGPYAGFISAIWPIALGTYLFKKELTAYLNLSLPPKTQKFNKVIYNLFSYTSVLSMITIVLVLPICESRAAWLSFLISSAFLFEFRYRLTKRLLNQLSSIKRNILYVTILILLSIGIYEMYHLKKGSSDGRLFIWKITTDIFKDNSINGVGFDRFKAYYMNYQGEYFRNIGETEEAFVADNTYYAFNELLQFITEQGLIGLLLLFFVIVFLFNIKVNKEQSAILQLVLTGLIAIVIFAFFSYPTQILSLKLIMTVLLALLVQLDKRKWEYLKDRKKTLFRAQLIALPLIIIAFVIGLGFITVRRQAFIDWKLANNAYQYGDLTTSISEYEKAYPVLEKEGDFLMNYGKALTMAINIFKKRIKVPSSAINEMKTEIKVLLKKT